MYKGLEFCFLLYPNFHNCHSVVIFILTHETFFIYIHSWKGSVNKHTSNSLKANQLELYLLRARIFQSIHDIHKWKMYTNWSKIKTLVWFLQIFQLLFCFGLSTSVFIFKQEEVSTFMLLIFQNRNFIVAKKSLWNIHIIFI